MSTQIYDKLGGPVRVVSTDLAVRAILEDAAADTFSKTERSGTAENVWVSEDPTVIAAVKEAAA